MSRLRLSSFFVPHHRRNVWLSAIDLLDQMARAMARIASFLVRLDFPPLTLEKGLVPRHSPSLLKAILFG
ncbi:hypothetical protein HHX47_DHR4000447, partial [Lentinula edodes]